MTTMTGQDVGFALRMLGRARGATAVALVTLAVTIGAVTAVFSVVEGVLFDTLAYADPDRVVMTGELDPAGGYAAISWENFRDWEREGPFDALALLVPNSVAVAGEGQPERIRGMYVTSGYFDVVGVRPELGRAIADDEDAPGDARAVVLSWGWWQRRFGSDPDVLGRVIRLNNVPHTIVGVMPAGFRSHMDTPSAWISLHTAPRSLDRASRSLQALGRLPDDLDEEEAAARVEQLAAGLAARHPETNAGWSGWVVSAGGFTASSYRSLLLGLLASVGVLLLIGGANVAGLQLARVAKRSRELAIRSALGGSRWRLLRQLLVENGLLALLGGAAGLGLAFVGVDALVALQPGIAERFDVGVDGGVLAAGALVTLLTAVLFGLLPAVAAGRTDPGAILSEGGRGASGGVRGSRLRAGLVALQVALSLSLLINAGLLVRSMSALAGVDPGFEPEGLLTFEFRLTGERYESEEQQLAFFEELVPRLEALPGAIAVTTAGNMPFADRSSMPFILEGGAVDLEGAPSVYVSSVWPNFPEVFGMSVLRGRGLDPAAGLHEPVEALVSERIARELVPDGDALGKAFYITEELETATIVGVVNDVSLSLLADPVRSIWLSQRQRPDDFSSVAIRTRGEPMTLAGQAREAVWAVDPDQPVWEVMPLTDRMASTLAERRFAMTLVSFFGILAALLAAVGIYGVVAYQVGTRTREMGLRMALGASRTKVLRMVLGQGSWMVLGGLAGGLLTAFWSSRLLESLIYGVSTRDPLTIGGAVALLSAVALLATWIPAQRATRVDPARTLQES